MPEGGDTAEDEAQRFRRVERETRELRARVERLERTVAALLEHPADRAAVREKVRYDWQA